MSKRLQGFRKKAQKMPGVLTSSKPPHLWLNTGFHTVNKIISGSYIKGWAIGRVGMLTGPSNAGKSLLAISAAVEAQKKGYGVFIVDSEFALDDDYMGAVGLDVDDDLFFFNRVNSISNAKKVIFSFLNEYRADKDNLPPVAIVIDSVDRLLTDSHIKKSEDGDIYNDQGLQAKMHKQFCSDLAQEIGDLDVFGIVTKQPYKNQDPIMSRVQPWIITDSIRFPFSQIALLTNVRMKDKKTKIVDGVNITAFAEKTRFCKPHQKVKVEVPYDIGLDPYSGILEAAESIGVVQKNGGWYKFGDANFQESTSAEHMEDIFKELLAKDEDSSIVFDVPLSEDEYEDHQVGKVVNTKKKKKKKASRKVSSTEDSTDNDKE